MNRSSFQCSEVYPRAAQSIISAVPSANIVRTKDTRSIGNHTIRSEEQNLWLSVKIDQRFFDPRALTGNKEIDDSLFSMPKSIRE